VVALVARHTEQEVDMLAVWTEAVRRWGTPTTLYLDNGSTYRGDVLRIACERLDVRLVPTARQPLRVVLDSRWRTPLSARLFQAEGPLLFVGTAAADAGAEARAAALAATLTARPAQAGGPGSASALGPSECRVLPAEAGRVSLAALLPLLAARGVNELHVEAGAALNGAWLSAGLVDELLLYLAPSLLGEGLPLAHLAAPAGLGDALPPARRWHWHEVAPVGADLRLRLRRAA
jgi:diaminohydroxyphosphoribosylaminopyrimidine deaminase/5-amino-6-(5-phosphoribosylamino)uracil reductase